MRSEASPQNSSLRLIFLGTSYVHHDSRRRGSVRMSFHKYHPSRPFSYGLNSYLSPPSLRMPAARPWTVREGHLGPPGPCPPRYSHRMRTSRMIARESTAPARQKGLGSDLRREYQSLFRSCWALRFHCCWTSWVWRCMLFVSDRSSFWLYARE